MKNKWSKVTLLSTVLIASMGLATVANAETIDSKATTQFKAPDNKPVDPVDPENPDPKPIEPTDPTDPNPPVYPGGAIRLNHIPTISFGINNISSKGATHLAQFEEVIDIDTQVRSPKASFVEVADESGKLTGWTVTASSDGVFKSPKGDVNGVITLNGGNVRGLEGMDAMKDKFPTANQNIVLGGGITDNVPVLTAEKGKGMNKWQVRFGLYTDTAAIQIGDDKTERNPKVTLTVPKGQIILADQKYEAKVTWSLTQGV